MAKIIVPSSYKGGVGKTTITTVIGETLASRGFKVLAIDLDSNCTLTKCYNKLFQDTSSKNLLSETVNDFKGIYHAKQNIDIIPSCLENNLLNNIMDIQLKINLQKTGIKDTYDYILIDPPGYWCAHTRNAVFCADILILPGTCSSLDFSAIQLYFDILKNCNIEADTYVAVNKSNTKTNEPGILEKYKNTFGEFLIPGTIPDIPSLKRLTENVNYPIHAAVKKRIENYLDYFLQGENNA
ncbi:ParA family protein [Treponema sp.]|uniref:ParA family protein n=1 Tax=Treponema sp. TaxID=166 RepID=UPI003FA26899